MFSDIEGSTRLFHDLGDDYARWFGRHQEIVRAALAAHNGHEVKTEGDRFFAVFASAVEGLAAAVDLQRGLGAESWPENGEVRVRVGLHTGAADPVDGDYISLAVHRAARVSDVGHGGQILLSAAAVGALGGEVPADCSLVPLGRYRLKDFDEPEPLAQVEGPGLLSRHPSLRALPAARHNVRPAETHFIGRRPEKKKLVTMLADSSIVTLIAQGGMGKSRLAGEVAIDMAEQMPDGSTYVELGGLTDAGLVAAAIVEALGGRAAEGRSGVAALADIVSRRQTLFVLDEAERVLGGVASAVETILAAAPQSRVLVTSRTPLGVAAEQLLSLEPLGLPEDETDPFAATSDAVALLLDRLGVDDDSVPTGDDLRNAAALVRRLDGLPLAIELAAARVAELGLAGVLAGLSSEAPQESPVQDAIRWSYSLLGPGAQRLFRRLRWLASPTDAETIRMVTTGDGLSGVEPADVADLMTVLAERSLVRARRGSDGRVRYRMLETVREVADAELNDTDEAALVDTSLVEWAYDHVWADKVRREGGTGAAAEDYTEQLPMFFAALDAGQRVQNPKTSVVLLEVGPTIISVGAWSVLGERAEIAAALPDLMAAPRAGLQVFRARARFASGDMAGGLGIISEIEAMFPDLPDYQVGNIEADLANDLLRIDPFKASKFAEHALPIVEQGQTGSRISALHAAGATRMMFGNVAGAREAMERCLELATAANDQRSIANALAALGNAAFSREDFAEAAGLLDDAVGRFRRINAPTQLGPALAMAGHARALLGEFDDGIAMLRESLALRERFGDAVGAMFCKLNLADSLDRAGRRPEAHALFGDAFTAGGAVGIAPLQQAAAHGLAITAPDEQARDALVLLAAAVQRNIGTMGIDAPVTEAAKVRLRALVSDSDTAETEGRELSDEAFAELPARFVRAEGRDG